MRTSSIVAAVLAAAVPSLAVAGPLAFRTDLRTLNSQEQVASALQGSQALQDVPNLQETLGSFVGSTASGTADLLLSADRSSLQVRIRASGLEAGIPHVAHIHGMLSSLGPDRVALDSRSPTLAQDDDRDASSKCWKASKLMA